MADISEKIDRIVKMYIEENYYFTINRARQYGKTTILEGLFQRLKKDYYVLDMSFEGKDFMFTSEREFVKGFHTLLVKAMKSCSAPEALYADWINEPDEPLGIMYLDAKITALCQHSDKEIILMIDEVDKASNNEVFLTFLGLLRDKYINREKGRDVTFKNVILASVYDIKNMKLKMRSESERHYNSPWNVAVDFDVDMSFSKADIATMLQDYEDDHHYGIDIDWFSGQIYEYTSGYPYLVSRICQMIDMKVWRDAEFKTKKAAWTPAGFQKAVRLVLKTDCTLFDDVIKNLDLYPELNQKMRNILIQGISYTFNKGDHSINLGALFGYFKEEDEKAVISNRIFETYLYDMYYTREGEDSELANQSKLERYSFIKDGMLDMDLVLERFKVHYDTIYSDRDEKFLEREGRFLFLTFLKPIINGTANYYIESETRDQKRTDIIVDYLGKQFLVELKIWHGEEYQDKGRKQLCDYLDLYHQKKGWLVSFIFNQTKKKVTGIRKLEEAGKIITEVVL